MDLEAFIGINFGDALDRHGKPALDWPSFEGHENPRLVIFDLVVVFVFGASVIVLPCSYRNVARHAPEGPAPAAPRGQRRWRPRIQQKKTGRWTTLGSQNELAYRSGLHELVMTGASTADAAQDKAARLLAELLNPLQRLELAATGKFRVVGAKTGNHYRVELGNGFELVARATDEVLVSYCLHPEYWIPDEDVALATKLALEDAELEEDCLKNARSTFRFRRPPTPTALQLRAADMARELTA